MPKLILTDLSNDNPVHLAINANSDATETAMEKTLSRDGTSPNAMGASLDMNNNRILNLPAPVALQEPWRLTDFSLLTESTTFDSATDFVVGLDTSEGLPKKIKSTNLGVGAGGGGGGGPGVTDGDKGDITVSGVGTVWTIDADVVTNSKAADVPTNTIKGRVTAATGDPEDLTTTQATTLINVFTSGLKGAVPASGGGTTNFLRADGTFNAPPGGGGAPTDAEYIVGALHASLSAERLVTDTASVTWDLVTAGQAKAKRAALTGDVTAAVDANATTIATGAVTTTKIGDDQVTYAKIQNVSATDRLLGRDTAAAGDIEELTVTGGVEFTGTGIQTSAFTGDVTKAAGGTAQTIANDAVTTAKIINDAVTTSKIGNDQVTYAKMQNVSATSRFLGRITAGAGDTEELTGTQATTLLDTFTSTLKGLATASGGGTVNFLRADGIWASPGGAGKTTIWVPAAAMISRTTNGAAIGTLEMTTNKNMFKTMDFDTTTQEFAQFHIRMPKGWDEGTVTFVPVWSHAATTVNFGVVFGLEAVAISDNEAGDVAFGTVQISTDTGGVTNNIYHGPESAAITIAGTPAEFDYVMYQVKRDPANGSDTLAVDARLHGISLFFTRNASTDD